MSWVGPTAKQAAKFGVKYGPHARVAWQVGGKHVSAAVRAKADEVTLRRQAYDEAATTREGSVLRVVHQGRPMFVVFAGEEPVASYPDAETPLPDLVGRADLSKRETPDERRLHRKVARQAGKLRRRSTD